MSNLSVEYDGASTHQTVNPVENPQQAAYALYNGMVPENLAELMWNDASYRDAVIGKLLEYVSNTSNHEGALANMTRMLRAVPSMAPKSLTVFSELTATVAIVCEMRDVALKALMRNTPENTRPLGWAMAKAIKSGMPGPIYLVMAIESGKASNAAWFERQNATV
jgi:hypothetical protein